MSETLGMISVENKCAACARKEPFSRGLHSVRDAKGFASNHTHRCLNFDDELRHGAESLGFYTVSWWPVRCRNGRWRWLTWVERHNDGTYTLGNRAH